MKNRENKTKAELIKENEVLQEKVNKLEKAEDQFRIITENTSDNIAITTFDMKVTYLYLSPSLKSTVGYDPEDLLGKSFFDFIHPEDKKVIFPILKKYIDLKIKKLLIGKEFAVSETIEYRFINKDGEWRYFQSTVNIVGKQIISVTRDITEHKQAEDISFEKQKTIDAIIQNSAVATFVINSDHKVMYWNRACEELTGIKANKLIGTDKHWKTFYDHKRPCVADIIIDGKFEEMSSFYKKYSKSKLIPDGIHAEGWYPKLGGKKRYIIFDAAPVQTRQGKIMAAIETLHDITDRKQVEKELAKHRDHLEELVEERTKELEEKNEKLKFYNKLFEGREFRIKELKDKIKELEEKLGIYD